MMQDRCFFKIRNINDLDDIYRLAEVEIIPTGEVIYIYDNNEFEEGGIYRAILKADQGELGGSVYVASAIEDQTRESLLIDNVLAKCKLHNPELAEKIVKYNGLFDSRQEIIKSNLVKEDIEILIREIEEIIVNHFVPEFLNAFTNLTQNDRLEIKRYFKWTIFDRPYILLHYDVELADLFSDIGHRRWKTDETIIKCLIYSQLILAYEKGDIYVEEKELIKEVKKELKKISILDKVKGTLIQDMLISPWEDIAIDEINGVRVVCINILHKAEIEIAKMVSDLSKKKYDVDELEIRRIINDRCQIKLNEEQYIAIIESFKNSLSIINGAPGTGKTAVTKSLIEVFRALYPSAVIRTVAPTGKAVERLNDATGVRGQTIHRLLRLSSNIVMGEEQEIQCDLLIVDEATMCSSKLFFELLSAFYKNKDIRIVILGDSDQLPSVEPGEIFEELCGSGIVTVTTLAQGYRQDEESLIYKNLCRINKGESELEYNNREFKFVESAGSLIHEHVVRELSGAIDEGFDYQEIQVVCPNGNYEYGASELNEYICKKINLSHSREKYKLSVLDRVIQKENNYKLNVYNGETGIVCASEEKEDQRIIEVEFKSNKVIKYRDIESEQLDLSYALTIHKMQGSSADVIILIATDKKTRYLNRKMIYVALSRAKKKVVVIGNKDYFIGGISSPYIKRKTLLAQKIQEYL